MGLGLGLVVWVCFNWFGFVMVDCWVSIVFLLLRGVVFGLCVVVWLICVVFWCIGCAMTGCVCWLWVGVCMFGLGFVLIVCLIELFLFVC